MHCVQAEEFVKTWVVWHNPELMYSVRSLKQEMLQEKGVLSSKVCYDGSVLIFIINNKLPCGGQISEFTVFVKGVIRILNSCNFVRDFERILKVQKQGWKMSETRSYMILYYMGLVSEVIILC